MNNYQYLFSLSKHERVILIFINRRWNPDLFQDTISASVQSLFIVLTFMYASGVTIQYCFGEVRSCVLRTFLCGSISNIMHHTSFLLVNLGFTILVCQLNYIQLKNCDYIWWFHMINIEWGNMFCVGRFFRRKFFSFDLNSYFSMQAA